MKLVLVTKQKPETAVPLLYHQVPHGTWWCDVFTETMAACAFCSATTSKATDRPSF